MKKKVCCCRAWVMLLLLPLVAFGQAPDLNFRAWDLFAETTRFDGRQNMAIFTGLRISQGQISIEADEGRATNTNQPQGVWQFSGNVNIDVGNGHIECDAAILRFTDFSLNVASVTGDPATFRLQRPGSDDVTYAEAGKLEYDVANGIIQFSENAQITEGGNQIESSFLIYNIAEQTINADSSGTDQDRVRITFDPNNGDETAIEDAGNAPEEDPAP